VATVAATATTATGAATAVRTRASTVAHAAALAGRAAAGGSPGPPVNYINGTAAAVCLGLAWLPINYLNEKLAGHGLSFYGLFSVMLRLVHCSANFVAYVSTRFPIGQSERCELQSSRYSIHGSKRHRKSCWAPPPKSRAPGSDAGAPPAYEEKTLPLLGGVFLPQLHG